MNYTDIDAVRDLCHERGWKLRLFDVIPGETARIIITGDAGLRVTAEGTLGDPLEDTATKLMTLLRSVAA